MTFAHPSLSLLSERQAIDYAEKTAITFAGVAHSFADIHERVLICTSELRSSGVRRGDRIAYLGPNHPAAIVVMLACFRLGMIFIPLNWRLAAAELDYQLGKVEAAQLFVAPEMADIAATLTVRTPQQEINWDPAPISAEVPEIAAASVTGDDPAVLLLDRKSVV